jgi:hypothetical protein
MLSPAFTLARGLHEHPTSYRPRTGTLSDGVVPAKRHKQVTNKRRTKWVSATLSPSFPDDSYPGILPSGVEALRDSSEVPPGSGLKDRFSLGMHWHRNPSVFSFEPVGHLPQRFQRSSQRSRIHAEVRSSAIDRLLQCSEGFRCQDR